MKKNLSLMLLIVLIVSLLAGCAPSAPTVDDKQSAETEALQNEINNQVGLPDITKFYEKKMFKEILELRDRADLVTYLYMQNLEGRFIYIGEAIGFGLPYSTQYSNPKKITKKDYDLGDSRGQVVMPQAEPNGLFTPEGLSATWIMYINPETGDREIIYTEPNIVVTQSKLPARLVAPWSIEGIDY